MNRSGVRYNQYFHGTYSTSGGAKHRLRNDAAALARERISRR